MESSFFTKLSETYPFISVCLYASNEYVGIIQNRDETVTTLYDYGSILDSSLREKFLELGETWWWESGREIPINIFLKEEWNDFKPYLRTFTNKTLNIIHGPVTSITELSKKKSKRKSIILVRKMP